MRIHGMSAREIDERIAFAEDLVASGMRATARAVTEEMQADLLVMTAAGLPGSRVWQALQGVFSAWRTFVDGQIMPYLRQTFTDAAEAVVDQVLAQWPDWEAPHRGGDLAYEALAGAENHMVGLSTELWENARGALADGFEAGDGVEQLAARVRGAVDMTEARARAAARTEVARAAHAATFDMIVAAGFTGMKEWLAVLDDRTRPDHRAADGLRVPIGWLFPLGEPPVFGRYPCDRQLPPRESVNCRCDLAYDIDDEAIIASTQAFRFDPRQPRDEDGQWTDGAGVSLDKWGRLPDGGLPDTDEFGGDDLTDPKRDKLNLAGRIRLGGGERLLSSGAVNADESAIVMAVVDTPEGRRLRLAVVAGEDKKGWPGDNSAEKVETEEGETVETEGRWPTVELDEVGIGALWDYLEGANTRLPQQMKAYKARAAAFRKAYPDFDAPSAEWPHPEDDEHDLPTERVTGSRWGDIELRGGLAEGDEPDDDGPLLGRPYVSIGVRYGGDPQDPEALSPRQIRNMLKLLDQLVADPGELSAGGMVAAAGRTAGEDRAEAGRG